MIQSLAHGVVEILHQGRVWPGHWTRPSSKVASFDRWQSGSVWL